MGEEGSLERQRPLRCVPFHIEHNRNCIQDYDQRNTACRNRVFQDYTPKLQENIKHYEELR